jgi:hypothetical protein
MHTTTITIHNVRDVRAHTPHSLGSPLVLTLIDCYGRSSVVTIFTGDDALTDRLVDAINEASIPVDEPPDAAREAAHQAERCHYDSV